MGGVRRGRAVYRGGGGEKGPLAESGVARCLAKGPTGGGTALAESQGGGGLKTKQTGGGREGAGGIANAGGRKGGRRAVGTPSEGGKGFPFPGSRGLGALA